jgi:hypothetical protein
MAQRSCRDRRDPREFRPVQVRGRVGARVYARAVTTPDDANFDCLVEAAQYTAAGYFEVAEAALAAVAHQPPVFKERRPITAVERHRIYCRDRYLCRYCGRRLVHPGVFHVLAQLYSERFVYDPPRLARSSAPAREATPVLDHVLPVIRGGDTEEANLVTACYPCNARKAHHLPQECGMHLRPIPKRGWHGLVREFVDMGELNREALDWSRLPNDSRELFWMVYEKKKFGSRRCCYGLGKAARSKSFNWSIRHRQRDIREVQWMSPRGRVLKDQWDATFEAAERRRARERSGEAAEA